MYTPEALLDLHTRSHRSLQKLLDHCRVLSADQLTQTIDGFGYGTVRSQLYHVLGAETYWIGVLQGKMLVDEHEDDFATIDALEALRREVAATTTAYLQSADADELNTPRTMTTFGGADRMLMPAHVVLRTQTHIYQHIGQVTAMCRLSGHPVEPGMDFPLA